MRGFLVLQKTEFNHILFVQQTFFLLRGLRTPFECII